MEEHLYTLTGNGSVTPSTGEQIKVKYNVSVFQQQISDGLGGTIPGLMRGEGTVRPFCGVLGEKLTLVMEDGKKLDFYFTDLQGNMSQTGPIY